MMGMLTSRSYPPSAALAPYITRHYIFSAAFPGDFELVDQLLAENALVRILQLGDWAAEVEPGVWRDGRKVVLFGANSKPMRVRVRGAFRIIGFAFRPCGWRGLFHQPASEFANQMLPLADIWGDAADRLYDHAAGLTEDADIIAVVESEIVRRLDYIGTGQIDAAMRVFESIARHDSKRQVQDVVAHLGLSERQFERQCLIGFGHTPKLILRRSRFLDMATAIRGLGDPSDEELAALRYFDQSHRNREFRRFIGMTPSQFAHTPTPLFTAGLQFRLERKSDTKEDWTESIK
ncbi:MAG: helix-turn-helix transcriptional regulator [Alphaproteobacteria bacterium]|nr:helix-turn-helix transcriptional regulator [Alphaproteobacteria bacterium]